MNEITLIAIIGACAPGIIVGLTLFYWERRQKKADAETKKHREEKLETDTVRLDLEVATAQLSYATAMALKRGKANGEMEVAIDAYENAMERFRSLERQRLVERRNVL